MQPYKVTSEKIMKLASAHWALKTLTVAVELSVFKTLNKKEMNLNEISAEMNLPIRSMERLLNALVAIEFLEKNNFKYKNTAISQMHLVEGEANYLGDFIKLNCYFSISIIAWNVGSKL